jgi:hypothetical protein
MAVHPTFKQQSRNRQQPSTTVNNKPASQPASSSACTLQPLKQLATARDNSTASLIPGSSVPAVTYCRTSRTSRPQSAECPLHSGNRSGTHSAGRRFWKVSCEALRTSGASSVLQLCMHAVCSCSPMSCMLFFLQSNFLQVVPSLNDTLHVVLYVVCCCCSAGSDASLYQNLDLGGEEES